MIKKPSFGRHNQRSATALDGSSRAGQAHCRDGAPTDLLGGSLSSRLNGLDGFKQDRSGSLRVAG